MKSLLYLICSYFVLIFFLHLHAVPSSKKLNVLLITADDLGWDSLGCMGNKLKGLSPNLDRLASEGLLIKHGYVATPICGPSRQALYTGQYPQKSGFMGHGVQPPLWWKNSGRTTKKESITSLLHANGYQTGLIGKHGSDWCHFNIPPHGQNYQTGMGRNPAKYSAFARKFFEQAKQNGKPFFLSANTHDPHRYWARHPDETGAWIKAMMAKSTWTPFANGKPYPDPLSNFLPNNCPIPSPYPDHPLIRKKLSTYYNSVHRMDQVVGEVLIALKESGLEKNTLVLFLSDHGLAWDLNKWSLYPGGVRTPLIIRWPNRIKPNQIEDRAIISVVDIAPTIAELCELPEMPAVNGNSFACLIFEQQEAWTQKEAFSCFNYMNNEQKTDQKINEFNFGLADQFQEYRPSRALNSKRFSYIWNGWANGSNKLPKSMLGEFHLMLNQLGHSNRDRKNFIEFRTIEELYDLSKDPGCRNNLVGEPSYQKILNKLRKRMLNILRKTNDHELKNFQILLN